MMAGLYWKIADDGAKWRCKECEKEFTHKQVILTERTDKEGLDKYALICLECIDEDWYKEAICQGVK
jgi:hypothetical protein